MWRWKDNMETIGSRKEKPLNSMTNPTFPIYTTGSGLSSLDRDTFRGQRPHSKSTRLVIPLRTHWPAQPTRNGLLKTMNFKSGEKSRRPGANSKRHPDTKLCNTRKWKKNTKTIGDNQGEASWSNINSNLCLWNKIWISLDCKVACL